MKKIIALVLCAVMLLSLCACGKSKVVKSVEKSIASIGEVTLDSEAQITDARKAYDALSKEEKEGVENYSTLKEAEAQLKKIKPIKLTTENIDKYLKIEVSALDYTTDYRKDPAFHMMYDYYGSGTLKISVTNQTSNRFENVTIGLKVKDWLGLADSEDDISGGGWEFDTGNVLEKEEEVLESGTFINWYNSKDFSITLPYDGNWTTTENISYHSYSYSWFPISESQLTPWLQKDILSVSGSVIPSD